MAVRCEGGAISGRTPPDFLECLPHPGNRRQRVAVLERREGYAGEAPVRQASRCDHGAASCDFGVAPGELAAGGAVMERNAHRLSNPCLANKALDYNSNVSY